MSTTSAAGSWILTGLGMEFLVIAPVGSLILVVLRCVKEACPEESPRSNAQIGFAIFLRQSIN